MNVQRRLATILAIVLMVTGCAGPGPGPVTSFGPPSPPSDSNQPTPNVPSAPATVGPAGLPLVSVAEAVEIRDRGVDRREIQVAGFLSRPPVLACPFIPADLNPSRLDCPATFQWLMANPESLEHQTADGSSLSPPTGPAIQPSFALVDPPMPAEWQVPVDGPAKPAPVELIGHFDDRRAALCKVELNPDFRCEDTFVIDEVISVDGHPLASHTSEDLTAGNGNRIQPTSTKAGVEVLIATADPAFVVLSARVVATTRLAAIEPGVPLGAFSAPVIWSVVGIHPSPDPAAMEVASTVLVEDGIPVAARVTDDNQASLSLPSSRSDQAVRCGRIDLERCAAAIELVRTLDPGEVDQTPLIAVDDTCPPHVACDRRYPFDTVVVLVHDPSNPNQSWQAYRVVGQADRPELASAWTGPLPADLLRLIEGAAPSQSPGAS